MIVKQDINEFLKSFDDNKRNNIIRNLTRYIRYSKEKKQGYEQVIIEKVGKKHLITCPDNFDFPRPKAILYMSSENTHLNVKQTTLANGEIDFLPRSEQEHINHIIAEIKNFFNLYYYSVPLELPVLNGVDNNEAVMVYCGEGKDERYYCNGSELWDKFFKQFEKFTLYNATEKKRVENYDYSEKIKHFILSDDNRYKFDEALTQAISGSLKSPLNKMNYRDFCSVYVEHFKVFKTLLNVMVAQNDKYSVQLDMLTEKMYAYHNAKPTYNDIGELEQKNVDFAVKKLLSELDYFIDVLNNPNEISYSSITTEEEYGDGINLDDRFNNFMKLLNSVLYNPARILNHLETKKQNEYEVLLKLYLSYMINLDDKKGVNYIFKDLNLTKSFQRIYILYGRNGSGKGTILSLIQKIPSTIKSIDFEVDSLDNEYKTGFLAKESPLFISTEFSGDVVPHKASDIFKKATRRETFSVRDVGEKSRNVPAFKGSFVIQFNPDTQRGIDSFERFRRMQAVDRFDVYKVEMLDRRNMAKSVEQDEMNSKDGGIYIENIHPYAIDTANDMLVNLNGIVFSLECFKHLLKINDKSTFITNLYESDVFGYKIPFKDFLYKQNPVPESSDLIKYAPEFIKHKDNAQLFKFIKHIINIKKDPENRENYLDLIKTILPTLVNDKNELSSWIQYVDDKILINTVLFSNINKAKSMKLALYNTSSSTHKNIDGNKIWSLLFLPISENSTIKELNLEIQELL
jgi:energy-coupling factor transporter ATP-binding protein EcfA2